MAEGNPIFYPSESEDELARRYARLVSRCARPYFLTGGDYDDLIQEGMIGLLKAIREYDPSRSDNFEAFAVLCIRRQIYDAVRRSKRKDGHLQIEFVELTELTETSDREHLSSVKVQQDPETELLAKESALEIQTALSGLLSVFETSVLRLYLEGYTPSEIAQTLQKEKKSVENAIGRIRRKLAEYLQKGDSRMYSPVRNK